MPTPSYSFLALSSLLLLWKGLNLLARRKVRHPPSPRSLPLIGNILSIPSGLEHEAYMELGRQLKSDVIYLELFGQSIVILNSAKAASDLLDKRSAIYSDRPCPPMVKDPTLFDWSGNPAMMGYNDIWRHHRRMMNNWLNTRAVMQFHGLQEDQARRLLRDLIDASAETEPFERVKNCFFYASASSMFQLAYGYHIQGFKDNFFEDAQRATHHLAAAGMFTNFFVNILPILSLAPDWLPGTEWKRTARKWRAEKNAGVDNPYKWTKSQVAAGLAEPSILRELLQDHNLTLGLSVEEKDDRLKELAMVLYQAGTDTSSNLLLNFVLAMVLNPHVQAKAQLEIDTVFGLGALPSASDQERLPYIQALIWELLRWRPVAPIAIPHMCFQDDTYEDYTIQKGTMVIGNLWAMSRDENVYENPEQFNPERFLDPSVPTLPVFGWGRRKCPGIHFAETSAFISITSMLAMFTFSKKKDPQGNEISPVNESESNAIVLVLKPFEFEFKPRSEKHRELILGNM